MDGAMNIHHRDAEITEMTGRFADEHAFAFLRRALRVSVVRSCKTKPIWRRSFKCQVGSSKRVRALHTSQEPPYGVTMSRPFAQNKANLRVPERNLISVEKTGYERTL